MDAYPQRDSILKGTGAGGGGAPARGGAGGGKTIRRADFNKLGPVEQSNTVKEKVTIVD